MQRIKRHDQAAQQLLFFEHDHYYYEPKKFLVHDNCITEVADKNNKSTAFKLHPQVEETLISYGPKRIEFDVNIITDIEPLSKIDDLYSLHIRVEESEGTNVVDTLYKMDKLIDLGLNGIFIPPTIQFPQNLIRLELVIGNMNNKLAKFYNPNALQPLHYLSSLKIVLPQKETSFFIIEFLMKLVPPNGNCKSLHIIYARLEHTKIIFGRDFIPRSIENLTVLCLGGPIQHVDFSLGFISQRLNYLHINIHNEQRKAMLKVIAASQPKIRHLHFNAFILDEKTGCVLKKLSDLQTLQVDYSVFFFNGIMQVPNVQFFVTRRTEQGKETCLIEEKLYNHDGFINHIAVLFE